MVRAAIIGVGGAGSLHLAAIQQHLSGLVQVVAICDQNPDFRRMVEERRKKNEPWSMGHSIPISYSGPVYESWMKLLAEEKPELVTIATNSDTHAQIITDAVRAGAKFIFCEKPISNCLRDADEAVASCKSHGVVLAVHHERRWEDRHEYAKRLLQSGRLGDIRCVSIVCGGARMGDIGTHMVDWIRDMTGGEFVRVTGFLEPVTEPNPRDQDGSRRLYDPPGYMLLEMNSGIKATVSIQGGVATTPAYFVQCTRGHLFIQEWKASGFWRAFVREEQGPLIGTKEYYAELKQVDVWPADLPERNNAYWAAVAIRELLSGKTRSSGHDARQAYEAVAGAFLSPYRGNMPLRLPLQPEDRTRVQRHA